MYSETFSLILDGQPRSTHEISGAIERGENGVRCIGSEALQVNCICSHICTDESGQGVDDQDEVDKEEQHSRSRDFGSGYTSSADTGCECRVKGVAGTRSRAALGHGANRMMVQVF